MLKPKRYVNTFNLTNTKRVSIAFQQYNDFLNSPGFWIGWNDITGFGFCFLFWMLDIFIEN
jgi:hypothetical protein